MASLSAPPCSQVGVWKQDLIPQVEGALPLSGRAHGRSCYLKANYNRLAHRLSLGGSYRSAEWTPDPKLEWGSGQQGGVFPNHSTVGTLLPFPLLFGNMGRSLFGVGLSGSLTSWGLRGWKPAVQGHELFLNHFFCWVRKDGLFESFRGSNIKQKIIFSFKDHYTTQPWILNRIKLHTSLSNPSVLPPKVFTSLSLFLFEFQKIAVSLSSSDGNY